MTPVVVWDVIRGIILPSAVLPQPMGPRNLPFAFAYALCPAGTLYRNFLPITNVCLPTGNVIEPYFSAGRHFPPERLMLSLDIPAFRVQGSGMNNMRTRMDE